MAIDDNRRGSVLPALIVGLCLLLGLAIAGYLVGRGAMRFRSDTRVVTVKGLVEREVKADRAVWALGLRRAVTRTGVVLSAPRRVPGTRGSGRRRWARRAAAGAGRRTPR